MKAVLISLIFGALSPFALARNGIGANSSWNCPQEKYPQIQQLRTHAEVKIDIQKSPRETILELHPDIFKINPFTIQFAQNLISKKTSLVLDYSSCIHEFKLTTKAAISKYKQEQCKVESSAPLCRLEMDAILRLLDEKISSANYFKKNQDQIIFPRLLPGTSGGHKRDAVKAELKNFIETENFNPEILFSLGGLYTISDDEVVISKERLKSLELKLQNYNQELKSKACLVPGQLCQTVSAKINQTENQLKNIILAKTQALDLRLSLREDVWKQKLSMPENEEEASAQMKSELEKNPFNCSFIFKPYSSGGKEYVATRFPNAISKNLDQLKSVADFNCLDKTLQNYATAISMTPENSKQFKTYCKETNSESCKKAQKRLAVMEDNLRRLFHFRYADLGERYLTEQNICLTDPNSDDVSIRSFLEQNRKAITCMELKPGEHKIVSDKDGDPTGIPANYTLKKIANNQHEIIVGINVSTSDSQFSSQEMFSRIQSCMKNVSPFMKGPLGEKLDFKILSQEDLNQLPSSLRPPVNSISILNKGDRSDSRAYAADVDCRTITHEVLHLLGLCDEYDGDYDGYNCRAVAKVPSVMGNKDEAFKKAIDETLNCQCEPGSTCEIINKTGSPQLKSLYLQPPLSQLIDIKERNRYCRSKFIKTIKMNESQESERAKITQRSEHLIQIATLSFSSFMFSDKLFQESWECSCESNDHECQKVLNDFENNIRNINNSSLDSCPDGSNQLPSLYGDSSIIKNDHQWTDQGLKIFRKAQWPSLLHPNHFKRIIGGACSKAVKEYDECAQWAYRNKSSTQDCKDRPLHCEDGKTFLGVSK